MHLPLLLAQTQPGGLMGALGPLMPLILVMLIFYFIVIAPMRKRQKELEQVIAGLSKGDKVVTTGGLLGEVVKSDGPVLVLKIAENVRVQVRRSAITGLQESPAAK